MLTDCRAGDQSRGLRGTTATPRPRQTLSQGVAPRRAICPIPFRPRGVYRAVEDHSVAAAPRAAPRRPIRSGKPRQPHQPGRTLPLCHRPFPREVPRPNGIPIDKTQAEPQPALEMRSAADSTDSPRRREHRAAASLAESAGAEGGLYRFIRPESQIQQFYGAP